MPSIGKPLETVMRVWYGFMRVCCYGKKFFLPPLQKTDKRRLINFYYDMCHMKKIKFLYPFFYFTHLMIRTLIILPVLLLPKNNDLCHYKPAIIEKKIDGIKRELKDNSIAFSRDKYLNRWTFNTFVSDLCVLLMWSQYLFHILW